MINITFTPGNGGSGRKNIEAKSTDTIKSVFERLGVKCEHQTPYVDGNAEKNVEKTFGDLGIVDKAISLKLIDDLKNADA